jgi:predicted DNA-binding transcriptional regulator YafY
VVLRLGPEARWVAEYYETAREVELDDGRLEVELPAGRLEWLERLLLRVWPDAEVVEPADLNDRVRELASRTRERYG